MGEPQNRDKSGKFTKGNNANPGGRPAVAKEFKEWCKDFMSTNGRNNLSAMANDPKSPFCYKANELIAAYAYGKPVAKVGAEEGTNAAAIIIGLEGEDN